MFVDHIALVTTSLLRTSATLPKWCTKGEIESFPSEGTREQYIEFSPHTPRLLLLEPTANGPYRRSIDKRGPGLHHIGVRTLSIKSLIPTMCAHGLLMHPKSIETLTHNVAWLCRPGIPFLIEVFESEAHPKSEDIELALPRINELPARLQDVFSNVRLSTTTTEKVLILNFGHKHVHIPYL